MRVVFVLRSAEIHPAFLRFVLPCCPRHKTPGASAPGVFFMHFFCSQGQKISIRRYQIDLARAEGWFAPSVFKGELRFRTQISNRSGKGRGLVCLRVLLSSRVFFLLRSVRLFEHLELSSTVLEQDHCYSDFLVPHKTVQTNFRIHDEEALRLLLEIRTLACDALMTFCSWCTAE